MSRTNDKPKAARPQPTRSGRLGSYYYTQSHWIDTVFDDHNSEYAERHLLSEQIGKLLKAAGLARTLQEVLAYPGRQYITAVKALRDKGEDYSTRVELTRIAACLENFKQTYQTRGEQAQTNAQADKPSTPALPPEAEGNDCQIKMQDDDDSLAHVGVKGGDYLYAQTATRELQPGELAALYQIGRKGWSVGLVESVTPATITITEWGKAQTYNRADLKEMRRVTWYARRFRPTPATAAGKINQLRQRLDSLNESDEITDCSARFKLEKQIYDLEQEQAQDEWPEVIGERGA